MFCPQCGNEIQENTKFCSTCGYQVSETPSTIKKPTSVSPSGKKIFNKRLFILFFTIVMVAGVSVGVYFSILRSNQNVENNVNNSSLDASNSSNAVEIELPDGATFPVPKSKNLRIMNHGFKLETEPVLENGQIAGYKPTLFACDLELFEDGKSVLRKTAAVNHTDEGEVIDDPLRYGTLTISLISYFPSADGKYGVVLSVTED